MNGLISTFAERLSLAIKYRKVKAIDVSRATGIPRATLTNYIKGKYKAKQDYLTAIARHLNVSETWLMGYDVPMEREQRPVTSSVFDLPNVVPIKTKKVPLLGEIACGEPIFTEGSIEAYIDLEDGINADFAVIAKGDSMIDARILNGDIVFIRQQETVENGEIAAVLIDDETTLKHVYLTNNSVTLVAANTAHPPMVFTPEDYKDIRILGRAIAFQSCLK